MGTRAAAPTPTQPTTHPNQFRDVSSSLFPLHPSPQAQSPPVPHFHFTPPPGFRARGARGRGRHGGDAGGRAAEGKWMPRRLAPPRPVASQIRELPSSPILLAFGPFSSVRPHSAGRMVVALLRDNFRCAGARAALISRPSLPASRRGVGIGSPVVGLAPDQAT